MLGFEYGAWQLKHLPEWVDRNHERTRLIEDWKARSPLVKRVADGETSLEETVRPLIEENLKITKDSHKRGICNSEWFDTLAVTTISEMKGVLDLQNLGTRCNRDGDKDSMLIVVSVMVAVSTISWVAALFFGSDWRPFPLIITGASVVAGAVAFLATWTGYPARIEYRQAVARKVLEQAKDLDCLVAEWRQSEESKGES